MCRWSRPSRSAPSKWPSKPRCSPIEVRIREAEKAGRFDNNPLANVRDIAVVAFEAGVISVADFEIMKARNHLRDIVVHVDDFPFDYGVATANKPAESRMAA